MTRRKQQQIIEKKEEVSDTNENVKKLLDMLAADPSFAEQAAACRSIKEFIALAKKKGLVLTEEEVRAATDERGKLSPIKLEEISGRNRPGSRILCENAHAQIRRSDQEGAGRQDDAHRAGNLGQTAVP